MLTRLCVLALLVAPVSQALAEPMDQSAFELKCRSEARQKSAEPSTFRMDYRSVMTQRPAKKPDGGWTWSFAFLAATKSGATGTFVALCSADKDGSIFLTVA